MSKLRTLVATFKIFALIAISTSQLTADENGLPTTEQFQSTLSTCAAGVNIQIDGDLKGSFSSIYEEARTEASEFRLLVMSDFLDSLPEHQKLDGLRLYQECVLNILRPELNQTDAISLTGTWTGYFTANSKRYDGYNWRIRQFGDIVEGEISIRADDNEPYSIYKFSGTVSNSRLYWYGIEWIDRNNRRLCLAEGQLEIKKNGEALDGNWKSNINDSTCTGEHYGGIYLEKHN